MHSETPTEAHRWLQRLAGEWEVESPSPDPAAAPGEVLKGTETGRDVGGLWLLCEGQTGMPDGSVARSVLTLGYDSRAGRVVGSWIGSMMTHLWVYAGAIDPAADRLVLDTEGPSFATDGGTARYQDVIAFDGDDARTLTSRVQEPDGSWRDMFTVRYRRAG